jgi:flagellin FlaB
MNTISKLIKDQRGMTGLETAIILIAFVTVAAVFGYAVLSAGLFSAERSKETHYAGLNEARSNMELCGSIMATSNDSTNLSTVMFTVKNAVAAASIDMTPCSGKSFAANKCIISLTTASDYLSNIKWTRQPIAHDNGNNLLEPGEQFEITVDLNDLGDNISLSENLTANDKFTLQVKPAIGATISIQRTLPAAIGPIMDLDLGTSFGGGTGNGGTSSGGGSTTGLSFTGGMIGISMDDYINSIAVYVKNTGTTDIDMHKNDYYSPGGNTMVTSISYSSTLTNVYTEVYSTDMETDYLLHPGGTAEIILVMWPYTNGGGYPMAPGETFTIYVTPQGGPTISATNQLPDPFTGYMEF